MKILVIGGSRFIGPRVVKKLNQQNHEIAVFNRGKTPVDFPDNILPIYGDRNNLQNHAKTLVKFNPEVVIDMIPLNKQQAELVRDVFSGVVEKIVTISSMDVYKAYGVLTGREQDYIQKGILDEQSPLRSTLYPYRNRNTDEKDIYYNYEKILTENVYQQCSDFFTTVLRLPMVYGPGDGQHRLYEFIKRMDDNRPAIILDAPYSAWKCTRGYVEDIGFAISLAAEEKTSANQVYNVGENEFLSTRQWIEKISEITGWEGEIIIKPSSCLPPQLVVNMNSQQHLAVSSSRIRNRLGYKETVSSEQALSDTIEWERKNPPPGLDQNNFNYDVEDQWIAQQG
ncbi:MAG: NAD-dependent epimerase/dehydratase family protein [bacterium]